MNKLLLSGIIAFIALLSTAVQADRYILPPPDIDVIGETTMIEARYQDTLMDIAREHDLGYDEILAANPGVDRWIPGEGTQVILPKRRILPDTPRQGLVLNLPELRLYYFPKPESEQLPEVITHPVGIGRYDWKTPLGVTKITTKIKGPSWRPPASIKKEHWEMYNEILPDVVPAGPDNPLGAYAMRLGIPGYLIHGTNKRDGVGSRVSHGCVRLYPEDIEALFPRVPVGTEVRIINQPVKIGWLAGTLFMQAYAPFEENNVPNQATLEKAVDVIANNADFAIDIVDEQAVREVIDVANGLVIAISP